MRLNMTDTYDAAHVNGEPAADVMFRALTECFKFNRPVTRIHRCAGCASIVPTETHDCPNCPTFPDYTAQSEWAAVDFPF
jgi:rRNA maturation endonuclease Nob1